MTENGKEISILRGKIKITATLKLVTGTHIGASKDFAPIGAVDSVVVRDPLTMRPIIPGSSLKGKIRMLLARTLAVNGGVLGEPNDDNAEIKRLFGATSPVQFSRLQFSDCFMNDDSAKYIEKMNTDLYLSEVKFENSIKRATAVANPRQIERVPAGAEFDLSIIYNAEKNEEIHKDIQNLATAFELLQMDYIGGHGSRGYGRVEFSNFAVEIHTFSDDNEVAITAEEVQNILEGAK